MKTRRQRATAFVVAVLVAAVSGCGARSASSGEQTNSAAAAAVSSNPSSTATTASNEPAMVGTNAGPAVLRAERTTPPLDPGLAEVVELVESGAGEEVVRAFVSVSSVPYDLTLEEIVYLRDVGVPDGVIAAMMRRGGELRAQEADAANLQTNLVSAVEQLKEAFAANGAPAPGDATAESNTLSDATVTDAAPPPSAVKGPEAPGDAPEPVQQFYSDLSPYGSWYQTPSYGWVWQPSVVVVDSGWTPYRHGGRWLWTNHGWYWSSDYSWGWAPFHYGRWCTYPGIGWCWVPGSVWGPSWVSWRCTDNYVGWAPLPPGSAWSGVGLSWYGHGISVGFGFGLASSCYTFVPYSRFCYRNVGHHAIHGSHAHAAYRNSTVINNVIKGDNNTIINNGMGYTKIASSVRGEIPKARVEPLPNQSTQPLRADRLERSKEGFVIYKPTAVHDVGGRPTALRTQVSPAGSPTRTAAPARPQFGSRFTGTPSTSAGKTVENSRFVGNRPAVNQPTQVGPRPVLPAARSQSVPASRVHTPVAVSPKGVESRGVVGGQSPYASRGIAGRDTVPTRQTMPVPLGDPSRNIPDNLRQPAPRTATATSPQKQVQGTRQVPNQYAPLAYQNRNVSVAPRSAVPSAANRPMRAPTYQAPRSPTVSGTPKPNYQGSIRPSAASPAPRISTPLPNRAPATMAPRSSYSAPAPQRSAPRAPVSAPAPARSVPSAGRGGQPNR